MTEVNKLRLTVGCRARILTLEKKPEQKGQNFDSNESDWRKDYGNREVLLKERSSSGGFSVMLLGSDVKDLEREKSGIVDDLMAWVPEGDLELINKDFGTNLDFMDWYEEHGDDFCSDCLGWFPNNGVQDPKTGEDFKCPNKACPSNHPEDYDVFF